jgi:glucose/arabinose dehydrogenase
VGAAGSGASGHLRNRRWLARDRKCDCAGAARGILALVTRLAVLLIATVLALAACGGDDSDGGGAATAAAAATTPGSATASAAGSAQAAATAVKLAAVGTFDTPLYVTAPPGDRRRIFVVQQGGTIRVVRAGKKVAKPFLDIRSKVIAGGEQGLLSLAFAPDYARTRRFYVDYTDRAGVQRVVEYRRAKSNAERADGGSARLVLRYDGIESNHNGGLLAFGPDHLLYIGTGDGGGANDQHGERGNAQNLGRLEGKLLRIDPRRSGSRPYRVPPSNPFSGRAGARAEIYSYGLRNPWRFSFDRSTGDLTIGDVGQDAIEEIDFARKGEARGVNYGWRPLEGRRRNFDEPAPGAVAPVLELTHDAGNCSVTGGYVVRDPQLSSLTGRYVYGDLCRGELRAVRLAVGSASGDRSLGLKTVDQLSSFGEDALGRVYVVSLAGPVYRLAAG